MRRHQIQLFAIIFMWVGAVEVVASFLVHYLFAFDIPYTPVFFLLLMVGLVSYMLTRIM